MKARKTSALHTSGLAIGAAFGFVTLNAGPAWAGITSRAIVDFTNNTPCEITITGSDPGGAWDIAPPSTVASHQTVSWKTRSNGGVLPTGTGGTVKVGFWDGTKADKTTFPKGEGHINWSVPYTYFNDAAIVLAGDPVVPAVTFGVAATSNPSVDFKGGSTNTGFVFAPNYVNCDAKTDTCEFGVTLSLNPGVIVTSCLPFEPNGTPPKFTSVIQTLVSPQPAMPTLPAALTSYWDWQAQTQYVFYEDYGGAINVAACGSGGCWRHQVVVVPGWFSPGSSLISYYDGTQGHLFFQGPMGSTDIMELKGNPPSLEGTITDITQADGAPATATHTTYTVRGGGIAYGLIPGSNLTGFWDGFAPHVFYCDSDHDVRESYFDGQWWDHVVAGATALAKPPKCVLRSNWDGNNEHVFYTTGAYSAQAGQFFLSALGVTSHPAGNWTPSNQTTSDVPWDNFIVGSQSGYPYLYGAPSQNSITVVVPVFGQQTLNEPTSVGYGPWSPMVTYTNLNGAQTFFIGDNQHVYQQSNPNPIDLTGNSGALAASDGGGAAVHLSPLTGYFDGYNNHLFFIDTTFNVQEYYWTPGGTVYRHAITTSSNAVALGYTMNTDH